METNHDLLKHCKTYVESQFHEKSPATREGRHFVTISRQSGAGGITIGRFLSRYLSEHDKPGPAPWTVFDKNLVAEVAKTYNLPERMKEYLNEEKISEIEDIIGEILKIHPAKFTLVQKTSQTILQLADMGRVIIVGRGANIVTRKLAGGFHVRLVGSLEKRLKHLKEYYGFTTAQAETFLKTEDAGKKDYLKIYFGKNIDDPLLYDLVINTDFIRFEEAARIIGRAVMDGMAVKNNARQKAR